MRKLILFCFVTVLYLGCKEQEQRYFADSAEIETVKKSIAAYESGDWDTWRSHFADTAKIYINSKESITLDKRVGDMQNMTAGFKSYGFDHSDEHIEMVLDKEGETWVYYWANHDGVMSNNKELSIPVHVALQFVDGMAVQEHVYFDATELNNAFAEMAEIENMETPVIEEN